MPFDDSLEEHRIAGISLRSGMRQRDAPRHVRIRQRAVLRTRTLDL